MTPQGYPRAVSSALNTQDFGDGRLPSVAFDPTGAFVIAWEGRGNGGP